MKLYGLASALLHDNADPSKLHIHFNPISMIDGKRDEFKVVEDLAYKDVVDLTDIEGSCKAFTKFINNWESLIERQKAGLEAEGRKDLADDLPIALMVGDAGFNQLNLNALFVTFSGQRFSEKDSANNGLSSSEMNEFMALIRKIQKKVEGLSQEELIKKAIDDPDAIRCNELMSQIGSSKGLSTELVEKVTAARDEYLKEHGAYPSDFIEACGKLPRLLEQSYYHHGRYSNSSSPGESEAPDFDEEIKSLAQPFKEGDAAAAKRLKQIAADLGTYYGNEMTHGSHTFKLGAPKNFAKDPELQAKHPEDAFFHWQDADGNTPFKDAFHKAFGDANWHPSYRYIKLPMDGNSPPYTDPVADMMVELHQIARGTRARFSIEQSHDDPTYRKDHDYKAKVGQLAEATHRKGQEQHPNYLSRFRKNDQIDVPQTARY